MAARKKPAETPVTATDPKTTAPTRATTGAKTPAHPREVAARTREVKSKPTVVEVTPVEELDTDLDPNLDNAESDDAEVLSPDDILAPGLAVVTDEDDNTDDDRDDFTTRRTARDADIFTIGEDDDDLTGGLLGDLDQREADARTPEDERAALVPLGGQDPLALYMRQIRRYEVLSEDEERKLTRVFTETRDPRIAARLVASNLRLVVKIAMEYRRAYHQLLDLIQEGNVGLLHAVQKYDPEHGIRLPSYAQWWIRAYILRYLLSNYRLVKIGTTQAQRKLFYNLNKERNKLLAQGFEPETKLLAERLDVDEKTVTEMRQRMSGKDVSIDAPLDDDGFTLSDTLASGNENAERRLAREDFRQILRKHMDEFRKTLEDRDLIIWDHRLDTENPVTLQDLGERFGVTRERARQVEARLKHRFRDYIVSEFQDLEEFDLHVDE